MLRSWKQFAPLSPVRGRLIHGSRLSGEVLVHPFRCYQAKQTDTRIGVGSIGSRSVGLLLFLKILHQLIVVRYVLGHLQRKAAWLEATFGEVTSRLRINSRVGPFGLPNRTGPVRPARLAGSSHRYRGSTDNSSR
jgi:hypothetical protein